MAQHEDPRAALHDKSVSVRAAAARTLSRVGTFEDLPALVQIAIEENSSALRLYAAAAAADILHRRRGLHDAPTLTPVEVKQVHQWVRSYDPGRNPGLLMMLSSIVDEASLARLARVLRDPRNGVRAGAMVALRRMALSASAADDALIPAMVAASLADTRMTPDVTLDLVRLVGEVGWMDLREAIRRSAAGGRLHPEVVQEALRRLDARGTPDAWEGVWLDYGLDVSEAGEPDTNGPWRVIGGGLATTGEPPVRLALDPASGRATLPGEPTPLRLLWTSAPGHPDTTRRAIQQGERTWWAQEDKDLLEVLERLIDELPAGATDALVPLAARLEAFEGMLAPRVRAMILWRAGALDAALALLTELTDAKKPRADLYWWLARVQVDLGQPDDARRSLDEFLERSAAKARYRTEAEALRAQLGA